MKKIQLHIHEVKQYLKDHKDEAGDAGLKLFNLLAMLEEAASQEESDLSDRLLNKRQYIDAIMGTYFEGRSGNIKIKEIREQLERAYDNGSLQGMGQERARECNLAVILEGGTFSGIKADRPNITVHKFDIDDQSAEPVIYQQETAEYLASFNADSILKVLEAKFN